MNELLAKRKAGAPLSDAEHEQRVAAAKARWTAAAATAGTVAAGAAGFATAKAIGRVRADASAGVRASLQGLRETRTRNATREARHAATEADVVGGLRPTAGKKFLRFAERTMGSQLRRAENEARRHADAAAPHINDPDTSYNFDDLANAEADAKFLRDRRDDLKEHGKGSQRVDVSASKPHDVTGYTAKKKGKPEALWEPHAYHKLKHLLAQLDLPAPEAPRSGSVDKTASLFSLERYVERVAHWTAAHTGGAVEGDILEAHVDPKVLRSVLENVRSLDDIEKLVAGMSKAHRDRWLKSYLLPTFKTIRPEKVVRVGEVKERARAAHRRTIEGYPDRATRKRLGDELRGDVQARASTWRTAEGRQALFRVAEARLAARKAAFPHLQRLALLNRRNRLGLIGGAAAMAGLGGYFGTRGFQSALGKAFNPAQRRDGMGRFAGGGKPPRASFAQDGDPPRVTMLIGMPGSGKSTWRAIGMARDAIRPTTIISTDDQVEDIARQKGLTFSEAFKLLDHKEVDRGHRVALRAALARGNDVIIDRVNASRTGRAKWLRRVPGHYEKHAVVFHVPEDVLRVRRANRAGKEIPEHALKEMREAFKGPGAFEFDHVHRVRPTVDSADKLRKAAPASPHPMDAADAAEAAMSRRLAAMFGAWTDGAEAKLLGDDPKSLLAEMESDLDHALQPLDAAVAAGAAQPVLTDGMPGKSIAFTFSGRSPAVTDFIDAYRKDRIAELVAEQKATIKQQLLDAAKEGRSPDEMARRVRDVIGLTSTQMGHVNNYRAELEELKGGALVRQLRDRRFDKPIERAIETGTPIKPEKIDQYVDAYHRRYLAFRATTIARTEGVGGANNGQAAVAVMTSEGQPGMVLRKTWIATKDDRTRDDHKELNGKSVLGIDTPFKCESGDEIRWPHDPRAPARQVINCRCSWVTQLVPATESGDSGDQEQTGDDNG